MFNKVENIFFTDLSAVNYVLDLMPTFIFGVQFLVPFSYHVVDDLKIVSFDVSLSYVMISLH